MNDFQAAMAPRSDQINAQDLLAGDMTVTIAGVRVTPGAEQPVSISLKGMDKVWRPCKTTGRILMAAWGADTSVYTGRSVQLYLDSEVKWGGMKVGGIRIRAMSNINSELKLALAESKQNRKLFTVKPLAGGPQEQRREPAKVQDHGGEYSPAVLAARKAAGGGTAAFRAWFNTDAGKDARATGDLTAQVLAECKAIAEGADNLAPRLADDPFAAPPTDDEIQRHINEDHARELARLDDQP
jgi:hypothetical protein